MAIPGYRIIRKIRQGGMSTVYLAIQNSMDREVALKVMSPSLASDPSFGSRFYREAKIVGKLSHPNIVSVYDVGSHKHYNYITMDYLPSASLQDRLEDGLSEQETVNTIRDIASALSYSHQKGFIHRDIKPDNILYRANKSAVLCDFGIAKALKGNMKMTNVGAVLGTPHYMSPEQAQGKSIDGRTDIYSLGVVFFEILSGQVPFNGDDALAVAVKHMTSTVPKLPRQYKKYQSIIEKMMAKKPSDRYQTGDELIIALDKLSESLSSQPTSLNTHTGSTTVQVVNVISTLLIALWSAINISFKRLMLTKIQFSSTTTQLSNKQLEDLDKFIFDNDYSQLPDELSDVALIQDTIEQPALRLQPLKLILPICLIGLIAIGITFFIQDKEEINPSPLLEISHELTTQPEPVLQEKTKNEPVLLESVTKFSEETIDENEIKIADVEKPTVVKKSSYPLTISTNPTNAQVRILNIKPRYKDGIKLTSGAYHIEVQAENYLPETIWLRIKNKALNKHIKLTPTRRLLATGSITRDKTIDGDQGPQMVVLPQNPLLLEDSKKELSPIKPIAISQKEITFEEYDNFAIKTGRQLPDDFGWGRGNRPVIGITYHDAQAYAKWLSEQTQQVYRLPTLIEWEYAYRGGETSQYWWGDKQEENRANCKKGCRSKFSKLFRSTTAPTASFDANPYGLYDIAGNAAEWIDACQVWKDQEKNQCETTLIAGGSHKDKASNIKANSVVAIDAESRSKSVGLRLLLEL